AGTMSVTFTDCHTLTASGHSVIRNGTTRQTVGNPDFCSTGVIGDTDAVTLEFDAFDQTERDTAGGLLAHYSASVTDQFAPAGVGCAGSEGTDTIGGSVHLQCESGAESVACPRGKTDRALTAREFMIVRRAGGFPCALGITTSGTLDVDD